jgi:hypothetical protein
MITSDELVMMRKEITVAYFICVDVTGKIATPVRIVRLLA